MKKSIEQLSPLGQVLREWRHANRYSLAEMAVMTGIAKSRLWELESRHRVDPQLSTLIALAQVMKKPIGWLANRAALSAAPSPKGGV